MNLFDLVKEMNDESNKESIKISNIIIDYCYKNQITITNLKLLKLLYFINIEHLKLSGGTPLFEEEFLAWRHGPVLLSVYDYFKYGITVRDNDVISKIKSETSDRILTVIEKVLNQKAAKEAWELVDETHMVNSPWYVVYTKYKDEFGICEAPISHESIYMHYKDR